MSSAISRGLVGMETLLPVGDVELCVEHRRLAGRHSTAADRHHRRHLGRRARRAAHRPVRHPLRPAGHRPVDHRRPRLARLHAARPRHRRRRCTRRARHRPRARRGHRDRRFHRTAPGAGPPVAGRLARAGRHPPGRAGPRQRRPARALPGDHGLLRQRSTGRTGPTARRSWTVRWPRPACFPARHSSTPPRPASTRPVFSIAAGPHPASAPNGLLSAVFSKLDCTPRWRATAPGDHRTDTGGARRSRPVLPGGQCEGAGRGDPRRNPAGPRRGRRGAPQPGTRGGGHGGARAHGAVARWTKARSSPPPPRYGPPYVCSDVSGTPR